MALTLRAKSRPATGPGIPRPIPYTRAEFEEHYRPARPPCSLDAPEAGHQRMSDRMAAIRAERDQTHAARGDTVRQLAAAMIDGAGVEAAAAAVAEADATLAALALEYAACAEAMKIIVSTENLAKRTDPVYAVWLARCARLHREWLTAWMAPSPRVAGSSESLTGVMSQPEALRRFAAVTAAELDAEAAAR